MRSQYCYNYILRLSINFTHLPLFQRISNLLIIPKIQMMLFSSKYFVLSSIAVIVSFSGQALGSASPFAVGIPQGKAAAEAYAEAYAEAIAIAHPDPEAYALAASVDDCASIACHAACGLMIINGEACSTNLTNSYFGPYKGDCLCTSSSSEFLSTYKTCMDCGWTLWKYYSPYLDAALAECHSESSIYSTQPTGTSRCSTTLTDSYTPDWSIQPTTTYTT